MQETLRDTGSIPGSGRSPGGGHGNPLQYSCLENPMDREAWWATVHGVAKSRTQLTRLSTYCETLLETLKVLVYSASDNSYSKEILFNFIHSFPKPN